MTTAAASFDTTRRRKPAGGTGRRGQAHPPVRAFENEGTEHFLHSEYRVPLPAARLEKGHVAARLAEKDNWEKVKSFGAAVAEEMVRDMSKAYVSTMSKAKRKG
jgi:hypothetical protein